jgi:hypothetical protein
VFDLSQQIFRRAAMWRVYAEIVWQSATRASVQAVRRQLEPAIAVGPLLSVQKGSSRHLSFPKELARPDMSLPAGRRSGVCASPAGTRYENVRHGVLPGCRTRRRSSERLRQPPCCRVHSRKPRWQQGGSKENPGIFDGWITERCRFGSCTCRSGRAVSYRPAGC